MFEYRYIIGKVFKYDDWDEKNLDIVQGCAHLAFVRTNESI